MSFPFGMEHDETPKPTIVNHYKDPDLEKSNLYFMESKAVFFVVIPRQYRPCSVN